MTINAKITAVAPLFIVRYGLDSTNGVWWHTWIERDGKTVDPSYVWHGRKLVAADEGGSLPHASMALAEAEAIAERVNKHAPGLAIVQFRELP